MLERFQQLLAAALGGAAPIGGHGHQHDRLPRQHPADAVLHQHGLHAVAPTKIARQPLQLALGHAGIVLQLEGFEGLAIGAGGPHPTDEVGGRRSLSRALALPGNQAGVGIKAGRVQLHLQVGHDPQPPLIAGRKATSSPSPRG